MNELPPAPTTPQTPPDEPAPVENPYEVWLPIRPAAAFLGIGPRRLNQLRKCGEIPARKRGFRRWEFRENDLMAYVEKLAGVPLPPDSSTPPAAAPPRPNSFAGINNALIQLAAEAQKDTLESDDSEVNQPPLVRMVNAIIVNAIDGGASDIHIEPSARNVRVRNRINGKMGEVMNIPKPIRDPIARRFCIMADLDPFSKALQIGSIPILHNGKPYNLRVLATPTVLGQNLVLHIVDPVKAHSIVKLGLMPTVQQALEDAIYPYGREGGLVLFSGPTGSGLTTTATAVLNRLNAIENNTFALLPVAEYELGGVTYVPVQSEIGVGDVRHRHLPTVSDALSAVLYGGDADIVFLGDIVGSETARAALLAAESGLKVFATVNAPTPYFALRRLAEWAKVPHPYERAMRACHGVLAQRLVRRLHGENREAYTTLTDELQAAGMHIDTAGLHYNSPVTLYRPAKSEDGSEIWQGMIGAYGFASGDDLREPSKANYMPHRSILGYDLLQKVLMGVTTIDEARLALR